MNNTGFPKVIHIHENDKQYEEHDQLLKIIDQGLMNKSFYGDYDSP